MTWESLGRLVATIGLIVLLILGAWGIIILAFNAPDFFTSLQNRISTTFGHATSTPSSSTEQSNASLPETLSVSAASSTTVSGEPLILSWRTDNAAGPRAYLLSYKCQSGISLEAPLPNGTYRAVDCDAGFNFTNASDNVTLRPRLTSNATEPAIITVSAISLATGSTTATASASVMVLPASAKSSVVAKPAASKPTKIISYTTPAQKGYISNPNGKPDLAVKIISVTPASVQFDIHNVGTKTALSGWQFTAALPGIGDSAPYSYISEPQAPIMPGSGIVYTLTWNNGNYPYDYPQQNCYQSSNYPYNQQYPYNNDCAPPPYPNNYNRTITITVDPSYVVADYNRSNNVSTANF